MARLYDFLHLKNEENRKRLKRKDRKLFFSQVLLNIKHLFLVLKKVQEKLRIFFMTFECPHYQLFPSEIPHRRHHLHLPQFLQNIFRVISILSGQGMLDLFHFRHLNCQFFQAHLTLLIPVLESPIHLVLMEKPLVFLRELQLQI